MNFISSLLAIIYLGSGISFSVAEHLNPNYPKVIKIPSNKTVILTVNLPSGSLSNNTAYWVFESHTQNTPLEFTLQDPVKFPHQIKFENIHNGIILKHNSSKTNHSVYLTNKHRSSVSTLLLARSYTNSTPMLGACNGSKPSKSFNPNLFVEWNNFMIRLNFTNAGILTNPNYMCDNQLDFEYSVYQRFLNHRNFKGDYLLTEIAETMLFEDKIKQYANLISNDFLRSPDGSGYQEMNFNSYSGTGVIFAVIVKYKNLSSIYVSSSTYACNLDTNLENNCEAMWLPITKLICAFSIFMGIFILLFGHRFFQLSQFLFAFIAGWIIGYIIIENLHEFSLNSNIIYTALIATTFGLVWLLLWCFTGIPILAVLLPTLLLGLLFGCIIFYLPALNLSTFISNTNYWLTLMGLTLAVPVIYIYYAKQASILSCAVIGAYCIIVPIDHYAGSSLKFIFVNMIRRATVDDFNWAVLKLPFQTMDITLTTLWIGLTLAGLVFQLIREKIRAPFPPNPYQLYRWRQENSEQDFTEYSPLLSNDSQPVIDDDRERERMISEIRRAVRDALINQVSMNSTHRQNNHEVQEEAMENSPVKPNRQSIPKSVHQVNVGSGSSFNQVSTEEIVRRQIRDPFKPPTPEAEPIFNKL